MADPADHYSAIAAEYAEKNAPENLPDAFFATRDAFESRLDEGARILDAGCGDGRDTAYFTEQGYGAVGVDIAPGMVAYAKEHRAGTYQEADLRDLPFPDDVFDAAWCCTSIFLLPHDDQPAALDELHRVIQEDGLLYAGFKTAPEREVHEREECGSTVPQYRLPADAAAEMMAAAGFTVERLPDSVNPDGYGLANFLGRAEPHKPL